MKDIRTITLKQDSELDMIDIANHLLGEIYNYFTETYAIDNPEEVITDYDSVVTDVLNFTLEYFDK